MKLLATVVTVAALAGVLLIAAGDLRFADGEDLAPARLKVDRFDSAAAWRLLEYQVELGARPAGSVPSRRLANRLRRLVPRGRFEAVPGGLRNVVGTVRGREPGYIVVGAHYDTKDIPGFVGANDGASGTAVVTQLARTIRRPRHTIHFILFDGEESPAGSEDFMATGLRGSRVAARRYDDARAMVLLDFVGDRRLRIPREANSSERLWARLRDRRAPGRCRLGVPERGAGSGGGRPHPLPAARRALDRPDRLRVRLLPPHLRQPLGGLRAQPRRRRGERARAAR